MKTFPAVRIPAEKSSPEKGLSYRAEMLAAYPLWKGTRTHDYLMTPRGKWKTYCANLTPKYHEPRFDSISTQHGLGWVLGDVGRRCHFVLTSTLLLHVKDKKPNGLFDVMDLTRSRDLTRPRPCDFTSSVIYKFPFWTYSSESSVGGAQKSIFLLNGLKNGFHN